jgi:hypothetical protein
MLKDIQMSLRRTEMAAKELSADLLNQLLDKLEKLVGRVEFGSIELVFHQGKLVQLEKNEKLRLDKPSL